MPNVPIKSEDTPELIGQIIDIFEDFLSEHNVTLDNPEIAEAIAQGASPEETAVIYGSAYDQLQEALETTLRNWSLIP